MPSRAQNGAISTFVLLCSVLSGGLAVAYFLDDVAGRETTVPLWELSIVLGAAASAAYVVNVPSVGGSSLERFLRTLDVSQSLLDVTKEMEGAFATLCYAQYVVYTVVAVSTDTLAEFVAAYFASFVMLLFVDVLNLKGLVSYAEEIDILSVVNRKLIYAFLRAMSVLAGRSFDDHPAVARYPVLYVVTLQTACMAAFAKRDGEGGKRRVVGYAFAVASVDFVTYAAVKTVVFVTLPLLEEAIVRAA